jgi:PPOX class probable F420-dependent enzyme
MAAKKLSERAIKLIDGKNFGNVAIVMQNGSPHVSPVWVDREGDLILINTAEGRVKSKYLKQNSKVALSIFNQENPYEKVIISGHVIEATKKGADEHIDKLSKKYLGKERYPQHQPGIDRILIKIEPDHVAKEWG